jgi:hypothetical protein
MNPISYRKMVETLMAGDAGYLELQEATGLSTKTIRNYMHEFLRMRVGVTPQRLARISGWDRVGTAWRPLFGWGSGHDAGRPPAVSATERNGKYRRGVRAIARQQQVTHALAGVRTA